MDTTSLPVDTTGRLQPVIFPMPPTVAICQGFELSLSYFGAGLRANLAQLGRKGLTGFDLTGRSGWVKRLYAGRVSSGLRCWTCNFAESSISHYKQLVVELFHLCGLLRKLLSMLRLH